MGATFSRIKNWTTEVLTNTDLNAEIDNILNNLDATGVNDYSSSAAQMKITTNPGTTGSESLATSLAGELERLRFVIQRALGSSVTNWYDVPSSTITDLVAALGSGLPGNRIVSGKTTGNSSQLVALVPSNVSASITLTASVTPFVYYVNGVQYSITANQTLTGLSLAAATNNTCSVNETAASGQQWTKFLGQYGTTIEVNGMNSSIASVVGQIAGFKLGNEYMIAYVNSTTALTNAWRGCFFNQTPSAIKAVSFSNAAEVKLLKLSWLFANTNSSLAITYSNPSISAVQPTSPNTGDYWFDLSSTAWKTYNSTTWVAANATLIGMSLQDTAACVAARTFDSYKAPSSLNTVTLERNSNTVVQAHGMFSEVSVFGTKNSFSVSRPTWDTSTDFDSGVGGTASLAYYLYMKESGRTVISDIAPMNRKDLQGLYYPSETWRCLGNVSNDSSTHFMTPVRSFRDVPGNSLLGDLLAYNALNSQTPGVGAWPGPLAGDIFPDDIIESSVANFTAASVTISATSGQFFDAASIALTPGVWGISSTLVFGCVGTPAASFWNSGISTSSGNAFGDATSGLNSVDGWISNASAFATSLTIPRFLTTISSPKNYYLKGFITTIATAAATYKITGWRITAERIDKIVGGPR